MLISPLWTVIVVFAVTVQGQLRSPTPTPSSSRVPVTNLNSFASTGDDNPTLSKDDPANNSNNSNNMNRNVNSNNMNNNNNMNTNNNNMNNNNNNNDNNGNNGVDDDQIGDFLFTAPAGRKVFLKAGTSTTIKWKVTPKEMSNPRNVTLSWRQGLWPNVSDWFTIAEEIKNENSFVWEIPVNLLTDFYIIRIHTPQEIPLIRDRISDVFKIYQGRNPIGNTIYLPSSAWKNMVSGMMLCLTTVTIVMAVIHF